MTEHDAARPGTTAGRGRAAGEDGRRMRPFAIFSLLSSLLALTLSIGYAAAPHFSRPIGYAPVAFVGTASRGGGATVGSGDGVRCAGPGCANATTVGATDPFAGGGSTSPRPASGTPTPSGAIATATGVATPTAVTVPTVPAAPASSGVAGVRLTLAVAGGEQVISAPVPLATSPQLAGLVESYLRCWRERGRAYALADTAMLRVVLAEPALGEATGRIDRLRAEGRVQWFEGGHAITVLGIEGEWAWLVDEYVVGIGAAPSPRSTATPQSSAPPSPGQSRTPTVGPPNRERVRATFTLKRVDGVWKIADSVSVTMR